MFTLSGGVGELADRRDHGEVNDLASKSKIRSSRNPEPRFDRRSDRITVNGRVLPLETGLFPEDFPQRLTRLKEASGLTWTAFAQASGVDRKAGAPLAQEGRGALRWTHPGPAPLRGPHSRRRGNPHGRGLPIDLLGDEGGRGELVQGPNAAGARPDRSRRRPIHQTTDERTEPQEGDARLSDMKDNDKKGQNRKRRAAGEAPEIGVVRVFSNPGPDAEDRLRRLLSLMVRHATRDGQAEKEQDSPKDALPTDDPAEGEA